MARSFPVGYDSAVTDQSDAEQGHDPLKRRRLLEAAAAEFARVGFDRANLDTITRAAGVAKGTAYLYFPSKAALFVAVLEELRRRLESAISAGSSVGGADAPLRSFIQAHLALADELPDLFRCYTSALFGVNRDFQGAARSTFAWQTQMLKGLLSKTHHRRAGRRVGEQATLLAASILAAALVRELTGRIDGNTAVEEEALVAMAVSV